MATWRSEGTLKDVPSVATYFYGRTILVPLANDGNRVLAFVRVTRTGSVSPNYYVGVGKVLSYVPLTPGASIPEDAEVIVEPGHEIGDTAAQYLRFVDSRGVPWKIAGYREPPEGFEKHVIGWTSQYGDEQINVEGESLGEVEKAIKAVAAPRDVPALDSKTIVSDDAGPVVLSPSATDVLEGPFLAHLVDEAGKPAFYALRSSVLANEIVGPATSLAQLQADVEAYKHDKARAALGLGSDPTSTAGALSGLSKPVEPGAGTPSAGGGAAPESSGMPWAPIVLVGVVAGLALIKR